MSRSRRLLPVVIAVGALVALATWRALRPPPLTVVIISIDTLRPERLGAYGNTPDVSPHIDALAAAGALFTRALAPSPWTLPSHMSMLTSLDPVAHGVRRSDYHLSGKVVTLAEALRAAGFRTAAFTDGGFVSSSYGFGQGFEVYRDRMGTDDRPRNLRGLLPEALEWMHDTRHEPSFVFIHTFDVHTPYDEGDPETLERFRKRTVDDGPDDWQLNRLSYMYQQNQQRVTRYRRMEELLNDYDAGVHEADDGVGRIVQELKDTGRFDNALIIVTSDHGEAFAERGVHVGHGLALTDDELHVPLILHLPAGEGAGQRLPTQVDLLDIAPTVLEFAGVPAPDVMQGESLLGLLRGKARRRDYSWGESQNMEAAFLVARGFKFISPSAIDPISIAKRHLGPMTPPAPGVDLGVEYELGKQTGILLQYDVLGDPLGIKDCMPQVPQLYDREKDPGELHNLWVPDHAEAQLLAARLAELIEASLQIHEDLDDGQVAQPVDPHVDQQLLALGYMGGSGGAGSASLLGSLPRLLRDGIRQHYRPLDTAQLVQADRAAQAVRVRLLAGEILPDGTRGNLEKLGNQYITWLSKNRDRGADVAWRLEALRLLAEKAGLPPLDLSHWQRRIAEMQGRPARAAQHSSGSDGEPDAPGSSPPATDDKQPR